MHANAQNVMQVLQPLIAKLTPEERLALIQAIAAMETLGEAVESSDPDQPYGLEKDQLFWFSRPATERELYRGQFVAVHNREVVDQDKDQRSLYLRVRARFGKTPVLIVNGDWDSVPVFTTQSPRRALDDQRK